MSTNSEVILTETPDQISLEEVLNETNTSGNEEVISTKKDTRMKIRSGLDSFGKHFIFKQKRVGQDGELFNLYKLRTMQHGAEKNVPVELLQNHKKNDKEDSRITPLGKFLRKTHIDEIPQILNIMKGDMTFFGPRPVSETMFSTYTEQQKELRKPVKPGLFGGYMMYGKGKKERTVVELEDIYLRLRAIKEKKGESMIAFHIWAFGNVVKGVLQGAYK